MDWDNYRLILEIHRAGSIRAAAKRMDVDHSTISRRLSKLRKFLDVTIFVKTADGLGLTFAGEELLVAAEQMETIGFTADRRSKAHTKPERYKIRLSIPPSVCSLIADDLKSFVFQNPDIELTLDSTFDRVNLDRSEADVVVRGTDNPPDHLVGRRLFPYYLCLYGQADYLTKTHPADYSWIYRDYDGDKPQWLVSSPYPDAPIGIKANDIVTRHNLAVDGFGLNCGACFMADPVPNLIRLEGVKPFRWEDFWVLTHPDLRKVPAIQKLMKFLSGALTKHRDLIEGRVPNPNLGE